MERSGHWLPRAWLNNHIKVVPQLRFRDSALCQFPAVASTPDAARYSLSLSLALSRVQFFFGRSVTTIPQSMIPATLLATQNGHL